MEIKIKSIDTNNIEKDDSFPKAYAFYIILDDKPDDVWRRTFLNKHRDALVGMKRQMTIIENKIRLITSDEDNNEEHVKLAKRLVEETNQKYKEYKKKQIREEEREKAELNEIEREKQEISNKLKSIKID